MKSTRIGASGAWIVNWPRLLKVRKKNAEITQRSGVSTESHLFSLLCLETPGEMDRFGEESGGISWTGTGLMRKKGKGGGAGKLKGSAGPKKITTDQRPPFPLKISNSDQTTPPKRSLNWTAPDVTPNIPPFWT